MRKRLDKNKCEFLGIEHRLGSDGKNCRVTLTLEQLDLLEKYSEIPQLATENNLSVKDVHSGWIKTDKTSVYFQNPDFNNNKEDQDIFQKQLLASLSEHSPKYYKIKREEKEDSNLLVIDIADLHINKYATTELTGAEYNSKIAVDRALEGTRKLLHKSKGFDIDKIVFVIGNDVLNTDNLFKGTTKGTQQDTDVSWHEAFLIAKECYVKCIEMCLSVADVHIIHCPSNHDFMSGCFLAETIKTHFRLSKNCTFDVSPSYRKYYKYHNNMLSFEHGDKGKASNLPLVYAQSQPKLWAETKFRYGYLHHIHHSDVKQYQSSKDYIGVNITYLRSPSSADIWHADNSYLNMVAIEGFLHSKEEGRVCHLTVYF